MQVFVTHDAARDVDEICDYIEAHDSAQAAAYVYENIKEAVLGLATAPLRGRVVPELERLGVLEYREVFFKPYRILFYVEGKRVFVFAVFDGRRELASIIQRRLFGLGA